MAQDVVYRRCVVPSKGDDDDVNDIKHDDFWDRGFVKDSKHRFIKDAITLRLGERESTTCRFGAEACRRLEARNLLVLYNIVCWPSH